MSVDRRVSEELERVARAISEKVRGATFGGSPEKIEKFAQGLYLDVLERMVGPKLRAGWAMREALVLPFSEAQKWDAAWQPGQPGEGK